MSASEGDREGEEGERKQQVAARDLIDFYRRWGEFRPTAVSLADRTDLSVVQRQTIRWLILLVDRISEQDLRA